MTELSRRAGQAFWSGFPVYLAATALRGFFTQRKMHTVINGYYIGIDDLLPAVVIPIVLLIGVAFGIALVRWIIREIKGRDQ